LIVQEGNNHSPTRNQLGNIIAHGFFHLGRGSDINIDQIGDGETTTTSDIATSEKVTDRFVSRTMPLAYRSPDVLERMIVRREAPTISLVEFIDAT
jgi:hypothetical protein